MTAPADLDLNRRSLREPTSGDRDRKRTTKPDHGRNPGGWWRRWNGIRVSFARGSASSSPTWRGGPSASSTSTTTAVHRSSISGRARARSNGRGCHAVFSPPTRFASSCMHYNLGNFMRTLAMPKTAQAWSLSEPAREADQDRRQGGEPRLLRYFPDGQGRGLRADVPGNSAAHRRTAGPARASMNRNSGQTDNNGRGAPF